MKAARTKQRAPLLRVEPSRRAILALAMLADVDLEVARRALIDGAGAVAGNDGHRLAIALSAMRDGTGLTESLATPPRMAAAVGSARRGGF